MILVRDVFQLKFGKAKEAKELWKQMSEIQKKHGHGPTRAMVDLCGKYYTFVMESTYDSLSAHEKALKDVMGTKDFAKSYKKFVPLVESGYREIFTLLG